MFREKKKPLRFVGGKAVGQERPAVIVEWD